jgi:hypothetical protein
MTQHRALYRFALDRTGQLIRDGEVAPCRIVDLTSEGVRVETSLSVQVGELLDLVFVLTAGHLLRCGIQVVDVNAPFIGARLSRISPEDHHALNHFIEQFLNTNFMGI